MAKHASKKKRMNMIACDGSTPCQGVRKLIVPALCLLFGEAQRFGDRGMWPSRHVVTNDNKNRGARGSLSCNPLSALGRGTTILTSMHRVRYCAPIRILVGRQLTLPGKSHRQRSPMQRGVECHPSRTASSPQPYVDLAAFPWPAAHRHFVMATEHDPESVPGMTNSLEASWMQLQRVTSCWQGTYRCA
jgi:hypothetical protein